MTKLAFVDTETTGLDPDRHEIWEVALIVRGDGAADGEYVWQLPVDLARADLIALSVGHFHERRWPLTSAILPSLATGGRSDALAASGEQRVLCGKREVRRFAEQFVDLTWGAHLVGAVPSFDEQRLAKLLKRHGQCPGWHYHLIDVEALAVGYLSGVETDVSPPWKSEALSLALGVDPETFERHSALGDARWASAMYDAVMTK